MTGTSRLTRRRLPPDLAGKRVLIVEDDYFIAFDMAEDFARLGAVVLGPVSSVAEALRLLAGPDAVDGAMLDVNLVSELVFPLAEALRERGIPFAFATAYEQQLVPAAFRDAPFHHKPVDAEHVALTQFG